MELVAWIQEQVALGKFRPGDKLYSENELKEMFHMSRQTVRHAIGILEEEGILIRKQGSGTYINELRQNAGKKRTKILVVTTYVDGYIFPRTIQGIQSVLSEHGYSVEMAFTNNHVVLEKKILEDALERDDIAGAIIETTKSGIPNPNMNLYREFLKRKIPLIFINCYYPELPVPHVSLNDRLAGKKATEHLLKMGHRKIGGIFKLDDLQGHLRYAGYQEAMKNAGIDIDNSHIVWIDTVSLQNLEECKTMILGRFEDCSGVVCYNDLMAYELVKILNSQGIRIPEDISLVSIDNSELTTVGDVELTSIPHPMEKLGEKTAANLVKMIEQPSFDGNYEFETDIVVRNSVRKLN